MSIIIYHNPRCSKSREGLSILEESRHNFQTRLYMKDLLSESEIKEILSLLNCRPIEIIRKKEDLFKKEFSDKDYNDAEWIKILAQNPKLIERPIVINNENAVIGRPPSLIESIL